MTDSIPKLLSFNRLSAGNASWHIRDRDASDQETTVGGFIDPRNLPRNILVQAAALEAPEHKWALAFPTKPGWYWTYTPDGDVRRLEVIEVPQGIYRLDAHGNRVRPETDGLALRVGDDDDGTRLDSAVFDRWVWAGSISPPKDAT